MMKKKISLPYFKDGTVYLNTVFKDLGYDVILIDKPTKDTVDISLDNSPEPWCYDMKLFLGQTIEGIEKGADIATSPGGFVGRNCLLGPYTNNILQRILSRKYKRKITVFFMNIAVGNILKRGYIPFIKGFYQLKDKHNRKGFFWKLIKSMKKARRKIMVVSKFREIAFSYVPKVKEKELPLMFFDEFLAKAMDADVEATESMFANYCQKLKKLEKTPKKKKPLKIGVIGDLYSMLVEFPIFDFEKYLAEELGVHVFQPLSIFNFYSIKNPAYSLKNQKKVKAFFNQTVGGSDYLTLLNANLLKDNVDGLIHLGVFGCTPEITAMNILDEYKDNFPPVLNITFDAHTQAEAVKVRAEAFIDMLKLKKQK